MAGIKGMKGKNLGGARRNSGPKPKLQQSTELALTQEEVLTKTLNKLKQVRDTTLSSLTVTFDCSFEKLMEIMHDSPEMLPPEFYALEHKCSKLQGMLDECKRLPAAQPHLLLEVNKQASNITGLAH
jgi:hypothetical protein